MKKFELYLTKNPQGGLQLVALCRTCLTLLYLNPEQGNIVPSTDRNMQLHQCYLEVLGGPFNL